MPSRNRSATPDADSERDPQRVTLRYRQPVQAVQQRRAELVQPPTLAHLRLHARDAHQPTAPHLARPGVEQRRLPTPGSPRTTSTRLSPARTASTSPSSMLRSLRRSLSCISRLRRPECVAICRPGPRDDAGTAAAGQVAIVSACRCFRAHARWSLGEHATSTVVGVELRRLGSGHGDGARGPAGRAGAGPAAGGALEREFAGLAEAASSAGTDDEHDPEALRWRSSGSMPPPCFRRRGNRWRRSTPRCRGWRPAATGCASGAGGPSGKVG